MSLVPSSLSTLMKQTHKGLILATIAFAQLMVVLDATIVNIALPDAQEALGMSDANRQWVVTAYTLTFGGLLLLGGRIADYWGRKRAFMVGMIGFALASALGGAAVNQEMLFAARALQGVFGALLAPAGLSLLTVNFTEGPERARAFGVFGAISGGGAAIGLLLGGVLTEYLSWHWCLLVNVPVALLALVATYFFVPESKAEGNTKYDIPGAVSATIAVASLVYGFTRAAEDSWTSPLTLLFIFLGIALGALFVVIEKRSDNPLLPLRIILHRNRGGSLLALFTVGAALLGGTLFLTFYFQNVLGYSPVKAGAASLGITAGIMPTAIIGGAFLPKFGPRLYLTLGGLLAAFGFVWFTQIGIESHYWTQVFPGMFILGIGMGFIFSAASNTALGGVEAHDAGAASAALNSTQQIGGSLGTGLLNTVATSTTAAFLAIRPKNPDPATVGMASVEGFIDAFWWAAGILFVGAMVSYFMVKRPDPSEVVPEGAAAAMH